ncbi:MAG: PLP-dependent transferase [Campylobacterales bacterium]
MVTKTLHGSYPQPDPYGALRMPMYETAAFEFASAAQMKEAFAGRLAGRPTYSRVGNPTVEAFERRLATMTGAKAVLASASGMAAISQTLLALAGAGDNIVASPWLFGHTYGLLAQTLRQMGIEVRFGKAKDGSDLPALIDEKTRAIFVETLSNPQLFVADITLLANAAKESRIPLVVDTTATPPGLFDAKERGVAIEVLSATKALSGGGSVVGGVIVDYGFDYGANPWLRPWEGAPNPLMAKLRKEIVRNFGSMMSPLHAERFLLGIETLALRLARMNTTAYELALLLSQQGFTINYPGLTSHPDHERAKALFHGFGSLVVVDVGSEEQAWRLIDGVKVLRRATNIHDNKSLIIHPWSTIYGEYDEATKRSLMITPGEVRISVGLEPVSDLIEDIRQALA